MKISAFYLPFALLATLGVEATPIKVHPKIGIPTQKPNAVDSPRGGWKRSEDFPRGGWKRSDGNPKGNRRRTVNWSYLAKTIKGGDAGAGFTDAPTGKSPIKRSSDNDGPHSSWKRSDTGPKGTWRSNDGDPGPKGTWKRGGDDPDLPRGGW